MAKPTPLRTWLNAAQGDDSRKTQAWMAGALQISTSYMSELLDGKKPSLDVAVRIEDLTGIPARDFAEVM